MSAFSAIGFGKTPTKDASIEIRRNLRHTGDSYKMSIPIVAASPNGNREQRRAYAAAMRKGIIDGRKEWY